ncbi:MAG: Wzz/FepE/Etk N-terminal domain-containing protein [Pseudomonadota bacterium]|nr:Wzz/FepE/Etk N-terminal domain-containing protein [Pseudomonadota bacterium]
MLERTYDSEGGAWTRPAARERVTVRYAPSDVLALLWRRWPLMLVVFIVVAAIGIFVALRMKETFPARSSILIRLGQEYVYQPAVGDAGRGVTPDNDQVVQSELEILQSQAVKTKTVEDIGIARMSPELGSAYAGAGEDKRKDIEAAAVKMIDSGLKVGTAPDNSIVKLSYTARDPELAALVLNTLVDEYLKYRRTVLIDGAVGSVQAQLKAFQQKLDTVDAAYQKFLADNGIGSGDFDAEKASLTQLYAQLTTEAYSARAAWAEADGRLGVVARESGRAAPEINLYHDPDHSAQDELNKLRVTRQDLLARYLPTAQPVRDIEQKIAAQEALARGGPQDLGARRIGPNPIYQSLVTEKNSLEAQAASYRERKAAIDASLADIAARRQKLAAVEPQYQDLARQRDLLTTNVKSLAQRAQESQAAQASAKSGNDNIRVIERAYPATTGTSLKKPVMILSILFAAFAALCAGLLSAFLSRGYPTAETIERTLQLPVLATAPVHAV